MIDYSIINNSIDFYQSNGFQRIESPWMVSEAISNITKPSDRQNYIVTYGTKTKTLVASAEQSFLYLYLKGFLPYGRLQSCTPCFRNETFDFLHTKYFIKNELIDTLNVNENSLKEIVNTALSFFQKYLPESKVEKTKDGYDIVFNGMELGSYGIRKCDFLKWVYGTGVAEPRLSSIIKSIK